jgi:putative NADH-flavin reductase
LGAHFSVDPAGKSWISFEDLAVAMADEIARPPHLRTRFTVGY